jgi:hypothetical protein
MIADLERRAHERHNCTADLVFSYFNEEQWFEGHTLNHCAGGMCFGSNIFLRPGSTVYIRVKKIYSNDSRTGDYGGLCSQILAEVKWCETRPDAGPLSYLIGVKFYPPVY